MPYQALLDRAPGRDGNARKVRPAVPVDQPRAHAARSGDFAFSFSIFFTTRRGRRGHQSASACSRLPEGGAPLRSPEPVRFLKRRIAWDIASGVGTASSQGDVMVVRIATVFSGSVLTLLLVAFGVFADEANQCVVCHEAEMLPISLGHSFDDWRSSAHGRGGVGCEKCHGGDPKATAQEVAHRGVLPAAESASLVNPARLPTTCGSCHAAQRAAFDTTVHARELKSKGWGATCSTCHGAMATSLPSPGELSLRCAVCHKKPVEVQAALAVFASTKIRMRATQRTIETMKETHPRWHREALERFHDLERMYREIEIDWHKLETRKVAKDSMDLQHLNKNLEEEAEIRSKHPAD